MSMHLLTLSFVALFISLPGRPDVQEACTFIPKADLEKLVGHELRDGKAKDVSPGLSQCAFEAPPDAYVTRRFENPALPAAANFDSITVTTFPTTVATFAQSRKTMEAGATDIPGIGDSAFLNGPAMVFVRIGTRGFSIRLYVKTPTTDAGRARLREVMLSLARAGAAKLKQNHESTGPAAACALQGPAFPVRAAAKLEWQGGDFHPTSREITQERRPT